MQKVNKASDGRYMIKWIVTEPELRSLLEEFSIEVGTEVPVLRRPPLGGSLIRSETGAFYIDSDVLAGVTV